MHSKSLFLLTLLSIAVWPMSGFATDLTKIDRTIAKEPAYKNKPKYCLLVFGPEAKHRVWLVQDGDFLYVDRNGNGDLTEPDEKIAAEKSDGEDSLTFKLRELRAGERVHKDLYVSVSKLDHLADLDKGAKQLLAKNPKAKAYMVMIEVEMPGRKGAGLGGRVQQRAFVLDVHGILQFADRAIDAPIIHFGGPLQVTLFSSHELKIGRETDVVLGVGSPGVGPGTTAYIDYDSVIPDKAYPKVEIAYPVKKSSDPPLREEYELKDRC